MIFNLVGSLGLFLLGMWLMTEGLKLAGGRALEQLLAKWTSNRQRGLFSGVLITGLVQSSSAVTVATIGFVNAGVLTFQQALWVVFGSNVGTTLTAWIVTLFGFTVKIDAFAFPLVGIGAALRIFFPYERGKALGMALAGFGLLFMGIDALKENFSGYANQIDITSFLAEGGHEVLWGLFIGFILTLLTQSSSAAIAIILTAVASGVAGVQVAAAAVIGANIGTTSTALIASLGATVNAKRLAWAHVVFNVLTAAVALIMLPVFWPLVTWIAGLTGKDGNLTILLAIFHTCFNIIGVLLMWPIEPYLSRFLLARYKKPVKGHFKSYLDANIAAVPDLAIRAMVLELNLLLEEVGQLSFVREKKQEEIQQIKSRIEQVNVFISLLLKSSLAKEQGEIVTNGLAVAYRLYSACKLYAEAVLLYQSIRLGRLTAVEYLRQWLVAVDQVSYTLHHCDNVLEEEQLTSLIEKYDVLKKQIIAAVVDEKAEIHIIDLALQVASLSRRFIEQLSQANTICKSLAVIVVAEPTEDGSSVLNLPAEL
ncbi:Na/Pi cotransporter family protein [Endozoicomonas sp. SM1973]|uniref:Na/Pi cotransporter family protein n=1 Tax=Spartinivicinus marinus TaxID=2994442 RepID=A0A853IEJ9_9GAMM|nr:Na/Pi symporter [Spartinivicinus marinus]NYZ68958.1 Na/Pi cotransporter family protein [Spartinivicinus marinus]